MADWNNFTLTVTADEDVINDIISKYALGGEVIETTQRIGVDDYEVYKSPTGTELYIKGECAWDEGQDWAREIASNFPVTEIHGNICSWDDMVLQ